MNQKIIATQIFYFGSFLQDQVLPKVLKKFRQHHIIYSYIETATIACYRWAIWLNPSFTEAHYKLGRLFHKQQKWQEAAIAFEQVIKIGSFKLVDAYCNLGRVLLKLKRFEEGIGALQQAITLEPEHHWHYRFLGDVLSEQGELAEAINNYQMASGKKISKTHSHIVLKCQEQQQLSAPNFLIIGQAKCGTSSLYKYLTQHPKILPAIEKEINFWNGNFAKGLDWYLAHFPAISAEHNFLTGEASPGYLDSYKSAVSVFQNFPSIKLIVLLRNPVDRTMSHYHMCVKQNRDNRSIEEAILSGIEVMTTKANGNSAYDVNGNSYLKRSQYIEAISKWMELFPKKQFLILRSEDLFADPATTVNQVFKFLGVEPYQLPEYPKKNSGNYPPISQSMHRTLSNYFRPFNQQLEEYLDRKFNWDSDAR